MVGVDVRELVFSGVASSHAVLTETEKELGVILVDIGGETTDMVIYVDGAIAYSAVIPLGGRHVTSDIAVGYGSLWIVLRKLSSGWVNRQNSL
jgi:cell division protein FtsA